MRLDADLDATESAAEVLKIENWFQVKSTKIFLLELRFAWFLPRARFCAATLKLRTAFQDSNPRLSDPVIFVTAASSLQDY